MCSYPSCSSTPTRIVITDLCPGGTYCSTGEPAFDLSGAAISNMALPGRDGELRNIGLYDILYKRVPCEYPNQNIAFKIDAGSSAFWISFSIKYEGGPGDTASVAIREVIKFPWNHFPILLPCTRFRTKCIIRGENESSSSTQNCHSHYSIVLGDSDFTQNGESGTAQPWMSVVFLTFCLRYRNAGFP